MRKKIFLLGIGIAVVAVAFLLMSPQAERQEQKRSRVLKELYSAIESAKAEGTYNCCIDPPCTMCYLGKWIWKDGSCHCDEMIAQGRFEDVCPECKAGIAEGKCSSSKEDGSSNNCKIN